VALSDLHAALTWQRPCLADEENTVDPSVGFASPDEQILPPGITVTLLDGCDRIETERLFLRRITPEDLPFYARVHADPDVARYLFHGRPRLLEETRGWLEGMLESYRTTGLGQLAIRRKLDGELIGRCGLSHLETESEPSENGSRIGYYFPTRALDGVKTVIQSELGYTLDSAAWQQGYASEAVRAVFEYARENRPGESIVSLIHPDNVRSRRLASRFAVTLVDRVTIWDRPFDRYVWPPVL
jgi:RimJ/RimL family protein N-acetyltransferase